MTSNASTDLLPTRHSLLSRLKNWDDQDSWRLFFDTYWKLIHSVARRAGLDEAEAQEAVQETVLSVAKEMPKGRYDKTKGTFKGWLLTITRRRIADQMRKRYRSRMANRLDPDMTSVDEEIAMEDEKNLAPDAVWEEQWREHLFKTAVARVKQRVKGEQWQLFELNVLKEWPGPKVAAAMKVSVMAVHVAKFRIGAQIKKEVKRLEKSGI
ncbi:MAG TPA: sigma-70 family RNA polymerase sigma factor [Verrucomicrobiales bacterium]|jgi:RNA polymerase sigma-70 factor (ECF subfamily)|nr:sigma-70 family RNA polymerase sigma factor [Verrucomicrobiales bacterium]